MLSQILRGESPYSSCLLIDAFTYERYLCIIIRIKYETNHSKNLTRFFILLAVGCATTSTTTADFPNNKETGEALYPAVATASSHDGNGLIASLDQAPNNTLVVSG
ncbi:hypothetical protein OK016_00910 [Vibrio chagasii]|nr:hypothetical protein [Vibrio chagasii]